MERERVTEVHYITPIANLPSILREGILSHTRAEAITHVSVADEDVQDRRRGKQVPNGLLLHDYANAYFDARNPMMYKRRDRRHQLVVVRIRPDILDTPGTVIADGNAASAGTRFDPSPVGLAALDEQRVYAQYWTDQDAWSYFEKKRQRCAEVLVPGLIPPDFLVGCYVCEDVVVQACRDVVPSFGVVVNSSVFFS